ncbi:hypothetical protein A4G28_26880 [Mycobacterium ostraviense]|uniref:Lipoprotein LpqS n=1 Tax=Mycobacterium ostraviense TaxID=2738409 RepID=A0A164F0Q2_9MYCO|nr:hypothetical protein A4G28_26880 [Mycobacterium ostraviense]
MAMLAIVGHCGAARAVSATANAPQPVLSTSLPGAFAVTADQPQLVQGLPICKSSKVSAIAAQPQSAVTALVVMGIVLAALAGKGWLTHLVGPAGRSPPRAPATVLTGQDLLNRFCLARR